MSDRRTTSLGALAHQLRQRVADFPEAFRQWRADVREDPALFWQSPVLRIALWIILGLAALFAIQLVISMLAPASSGRSAFEAPTPFATLYVACENPDCLAAYSTQTPMDFRAWPMKCEKCGQPTVYRARTCPKCHEWISSRDAEAGKCPRCAKRDEQNRPKPPKARSGGDPDDEEDPW